MKLKQYIKNLNDLVRDKPELLQYDVLHSRDEEGNGYEKIYYEPSLGHLEGGVFEVGQYYKENPEEYEGFEINAICIN